MSEPVATDPKPDLAAVLKQWAPFLASRARRFAKHLCLEADEVLGEAVLAIVRRYATFDPTRGAFSTWSDTLVLRAAYSLHRARRRSVEGRRPVQWSGRGGRFDETFVHVAEQAPDPDAPDPTEVAAGAEWRDAVRSAVEGLPDDLREIVNAKFFAVGESAGRSTRHDRAGLAEALAALREEPAIARLAAELGG